MNVTPKLVPADFQMPPPKPKRAKRIVGSSEKEQKKVVKMSEPLSGGRIQEKKSPAKKGKKSKHVKGFKKAKKNLDDFSDLYKSLE